MLCESRLESVGDSDRDVRTEVGLMSARRWIPLLSLLIAVAPWSGCHQRSESAHLSTATRLNHRAQHPVPTFRVPHNRGSLASPTPWRFRRFVGTEGHVPSITEVDLGPVSPSDDLQQVRTVSPRATHSFTSLPLRC